MKKKLFLIILLLVSIRTVYAKETIVDHITGLYNNAQKVEVIHYMSNNNITYHYAPSVDLMNDRLGGTTSLDGGNIRYYGVVGKETGVSEAEADGSEYVGNWDTLGEPSITTPEACTMMLEGEINYMLSETGYSTLEDYVAGATEYSTVEDFMTATFGYDSIESFCSYSDEVRYYRYKVKNYIDIGDKTTTDISFNNWELFSVIGGTFNSAEECMEEMNYIAQNYGVPISLLDTEVSLNGSAYGINSVAEYCSTSIIPAGTPILWRIIGVFDGKLRVIRDESIGSYSWDTSKSTINSGGGINEWSQADLMKLLNPGYENNRDYYNCGNNCVYNEETRSDECECEGEVLVNNSLWWNSESGNCYSDGRNGITSCNFASSGLSDSVKNSLIDQTIYLGGLSGLWGYANTIYQEERGTNVVQNSSDGFARTTTWTGKVALPYLSDFGYATDFNYCQNNSVISYINNRPCATNSWMHSYEPAWAMDHTLDEYDGAEMITYGRGYSDSVSFGSASWTWNIHPTLTLNPSLILKSGIGTKDDPYVVGVEGYTATIRYFGEDKKLLDIEDNPLILNDLPSGYTETIKSPKVSGCYAKDVKVSIADKDEVYDVYYSCSVIINPKTGRLLMILGAILGIASIGYLLYYIKNKREIFD